MDPYQIDLLGVPWLGTGLMALAVGGGIFYVTRSLSSPEPKDHLPTPTEVRARLEMAKCPNEMINSPSRNGRRNLWDRLSPLFYEETNSGMWKISLGRVAFWSTQVAFIGMCATVMFSLKDEHDVSANLVTLYISVLTMLFLTNLGLLGYNLGSKFTEPMKQFIASWGNRVPDLNLETAAGQIQKVSVRPSEAPTKPELFLDAPTDQGDTIAENTGLSLDDFDGVVEDED